MYTTWYISCISSFYMISTDSDFSDRAGFLILDFIRIVPGASACATISATNDPLLEGPEVFGFQILQDTDLPDVVIFHNDIRVILNDNGMTIECYCGQLSLPQACAVHAYRQGIMPNLGELNLVYSEFLL